MREKKSRPIALLRGNLVELAVAFIIGVTIVILFALLRSVLLPILLRNSPDDLNLVIVDGKGLDYPIYSKPANLCNITATDAFTVWQRGHYVATARALFPSDSPASADRWLRDLVGVLYEGIFSDPLRRELR